MFDPTPIRREQAWIREEFMSVRREQTDMSMHFWGAYLLILPPCSCIHLVVNSLLIHLKYIDGFPQHVSNKGSLFQ